ncbi:MAG: hypothetical protein NZ942_01540, partial [Candidatus Aenigmarchaeota archaeon]|nr:hypothetical protein [Candidatus Aenigmarchaeota archaeon]
RILSSFFFIFSLPSILIRREDFLSSMKTSFEVVRKNFLNSLFFWLLIHLIYLLLMFASYVLIVISISPLLLRIISTYQFFSLVQTPETILIQIVGTVMHSIESIILSLTIFSFFFSYSYVFLTTAKTYYFLLLTRKKLISSKQS